MAAPVRRLPTWLVVLGTLLVGGLLFGALDRWVYRDEGRAATAPPPAPPPRRDVPPEEALPVWLAPAEDDEDGLPVVEMRFAGQTWYLAHPESGGTPQEITGTWNRLAPHYSDVRRAFTEAVRLLQEREPLRQTGVIRPQGDALEVPSTVVDFVGDSFADAGVYEVVVLR